MVNKGFMAQTYLGIGLLFIVNEIVTIVAYFGTKKFIDPECSRTRDFEAGAEE